MTGTLQSKCPACGLATHPDRPALSLGPWSASWVSRGLCPNCGQGPDAPAPPPSRPGLLSAFLGFLQRGLRR
jgi:rRNA maturation protein Nop10